MVKTATGLHNSVVDAINAAWDSGPKMDWLGMEVCLREALRLAPESQYTPTLRLVDEIIAAFTKRGGQLPQ